MRSPLALVVLLSLSPAARAVPGAGPAPVTAESQADWRRDGVDDRVKPALTAKGWRFEDDGRALDPKTKAPATKAVLDKTILDLRQDARRAALETVNLTLSRGKPLDDAERTRLLKMSEDLPPGLVAAITDPKSDVNRMKTLADSELDKVSAYFDGGRTLADRQAAAQPVAAGTPGPRVGLPYFSASEKSVGDKLRTAAASEIGRDPFGKTVLSRLNDKSRKPDLPPIVIEDQSGPVVAQYDIRRQSLVLDREAVTASIVGSVAPQHRIALRKSLSTKTDLLAYLDAHPEAVSVVVKDNDVVIVHELTHAWQDRRDTIFREIVRGNLPDTQPVEYEEEAYMTKNLYLNSKMKNDPGSVKFDKEFDDAIAMMHAPTLWSAELGADMKKTSPARAMNLDSVAEVQKARLAKVSARATATRDEQTAKALDLLAMTRAQRELAALGPAHAARTTAIADQIYADRPERAKMLGTFYLARALNAANSVERSALMDKAEVFARASKNAILIEEVRKAKGSK